MGRADQTTKVRGMFVHPARWPRWPSASRRSKARLVVSGEMANDQMRCRWKPPKPPKAWPAWRRHARSHQAARRGADGAPGSLPNDGKVIEDARSYR
jgi:phenylacetate-CoA ligase